MAKKKVFDTNEFLVKAQLAKKVMDKKEHKQKLFVELTDFGKKIAGLSRNLDSFEKVYDKYVKSEYDNFHTSSHLKSNVRKNLLLSKGWNKEEIEDYEQDFEKVKLFEVDSLNMLLDSLMNNYGLYLLRFNLNAHAKEFIAKLFSDKIAYYIQKKYDKIVPEKDYNKKCEKCNHDLSPQILKKNKIYEIYQNNDTLFFGRIQLYVKPIIANRFIGNETKMLLSCAFDIMDFPEEHIQNRINHEKNSMDSNSLDELDIKVNSFYDELLNRI